eukprot:tig00020531_g10063.t1
MSGSSDDKETVVDNAAANDDEHSIVDMDDVRQSNIRDLMKLIRAFGGGSTDVSRKTPGRRKRTDTEEGSDSREEAKPRRRSARLVGKVSTAVPEQPERRRRRAGSAKKITVRRLFVFPADKLRSCRAPPSAALLLNLEAKRRLGLYDKETGVTCHQCRQKTTDRKSECANEQCCKTEKGHLCGKCLYDRYGENIEEVWADPEWVCPVCRGFCNCSFCWKELTGGEATGALAPRARMLGYLSVAHYLADYSPGLRPPGIDRTTLMQPGREPPERKDEHDLSEDATVEQAVAPVESAREGSAAPAVEAEEQLEDVEVVVSDDGYTEDEGNSEEEGVFEVKKSF